jgi:hypothetical protein
MMYVPSPVHEDSSEVFCYQLEFTGPLTGFSMKC